jgi:hypothetical protein
MTNDELSAKVAEARGGKCAQGTRTNYRCPDDCSYCDVKIPDYATDMNAAWELVEEMRKHGVVTITSSPDRTQYSEEACPNYTATFVKFRSKVKVRGSSHSPSTAVSKLFLAFKGVEK